MATHLAVAVLNRISAVDVRRDRGSGVVETIIIVAGFAGLAFAVYVAVSGKVHGWINKIPGSIGP
ncbi:hypothetical protein [Actinomadura chibensis]|uniref:hypothetical protein n=1 Tax=Actinomadura chibensis TaxID=392828 RepID=UPI0012FB090D|nr:hypothetical protein [Actinomadura chibensis]